MPGVPLTMPRVSDENLILTEAEARDVLIFFWPSRADRLDQIQLDTKERKFAQSLLIAAVDGSYAIGFFRGVLEVFYRNPGAGMRKIMKKIARRCVEHWWRHATREKLRNPKIYEAIRRALASKHRSRIELILRGYSDAARPPERRIVLLTVPRVPKPIAWG